MAKGDMDDIAAALLAKADELKSLAGTSESGSKAAVRKYYAAIESLLAAPGSTYATVLSVLESKGLKMTPATFATNLSMVRKEQPDYRPRQRKLAAAKARPTSDKKNFGIHANGPASTTLVQRHIPVPSAPESLDAPVDPKRKNLNREL